MLVKLGGILSVLAVVFWLWCLWEAITAPEQKVRSLPKLAWVFIVLILFELGAALWWVFGRPRASGGPGREAQRRRPGPVAPDDDPDFLRRLDDDLRHRRRDGDPTD